MLIEELETRLRTVLLLVTPSTGLILLDFTLEIKLLDLLLDPPDLNWYLALPTAS